jgi:hypothetical protein
MRTTPLELHCWGGLGSQLYALSYLLELKSQRIDRDIILVFHTGGVTLRRCEVGDTLKTSRIPFREVDDFGLSFLSVFIRKILNFFALFLGFSIKDPNNRDVLGRKRLTKIRGHYSSRVHSIENVGSLARLFSLFPDSTKDLSGSVQLHMRIGDLEFLETKAPLSIERIVKALEILPEDSSSRDIVVHSDSPDKAIIELSKFFSGFKFKSGNSSALDVILQQRHSSVFIATPSKISEWAICLRLYRDAGNVTFAPREMQIDLLSKFPFLNDCPGLQFY